MSKIFDSPGYADSLSKDILLKWNKKIEDVYNGLVEENGSKYFELDPSKLYSAQTTASVKWFADPAEPNFCKGSTIAQKLSDWGTRGRHELHNEYCEYAITWQKDATGKLRPKRVQVTTELREYWVTLAVHKPAVLLKILSQILGFKPDWSLIYGSDPKTMSGEDRLINFCKLVAGSGGDADLESKGVPSQPVGKLNHENAIFMTHPINGLDDLLYIVMFGSKPYARKVGAKVLPATKEQIFRSSPDLEGLACRHADPAAAMGAHAAVFSGRKVAFANPIGMYIHSFASSLFTYNDYPVPAGWIKLSRGNKNLYQRLVFGPADHEDVYLDDMRVEIGGNSKPLIGGFQVLQQIEVGPMIALGKPSALAPTEYEILKSSTDPIICGDAKICIDIEQLWNSYNVAPHQ